MKRAILVLLLATTALWAAKPDPLDGLWQGYDGEWRHCSQQLVALAGVVPQEKYSWRPAASVRSTSEVLMHIAISNYALLAATGKPFPKGLNGESETAVTNKEQVMGWLRRSLDTVKEAHLQVTPTDLTRHLRFESRDVTVEGMYLRILVHANEHMGQLVAYARVNAIAPPWSAKAEK